VCPALVVTVLGCLSRLEYHLKLLLSFALRNLQFIQVLLLVLLDLLQTHCSSIRTDLTQLLFSIALGRFQNFLLELFLFKLEDRHFAVVFSY
jgi:hypothetical protein